MPKETLLILIIISGSILALYLLTVIVALIFVLSFRKIMKQHSKSLAIILTSKKEIILKIFQLIRSLGIEVEDEVFITLSVDPNIFSTPDSGLSKEVSEQLSLLRDKAFLLANLNKDIEKHKEFTLLKDYILEIDKVYRIKLAMYNADVLGYNYWINFLPTRYIFKIFRCKEKELI